MNLPLKTSLPHIVLTLCVYLSLVRGTNIGLFYPSDEYFLGTINYTPQTIMNFLLLGGLMAYFFLIRDFRFIIDGLSGALMALVAGGIALTTVFSSDIILSLKYILALSVVSLPIILYAREEQGVKSLSNHFGFFIISMAYLNMIYVLVFPQYAIMSGNHEGRWKGLFEHKNTAGPFFVFSTLILIYAVHLPRHFLVQMVRWVAVLISIVFVIKSGSSTAYVLMALIFPLLVAIFEFLFRLRDGAQRVGVALVSFAAVVFIITFFGDNLAQLFFQLTGRDPSLTGRIGVWSALMDVVYQQPLLGHGIGLSESIPFMERIQGQVGWEVKGTHNGYIDLLLNFGFPTFILMMLTLLSPFRAIYRLPALVNLEKAQIVLVMTMMCVLLLLGFSNSATYFSRSFVWIFYIFSMLSVYYIQKQENKSDRL